MNGSMQKYLNSQPQTLSNATESSVRLRATQGAPCELQSLQMPGVSTLDQPMQGRLESLINYDDQFSEQERNWEGLDSQTLEELRL
jgi:hypothetical protein